MTGTLTIRDEALSGEALRECALAVATESLTPR
jgi:hypothetical protein